jgi:hypothetical protein
MYVPSAIFSFSKFRRALPNFLPELSLTCLFQPTEHPDQSAQTSGLPFWSLICATGAFTGKGLCVEAAQLHSSVQARKLLEKHERAQDIRIASSKAA